MGRLRYTPALLAQERKAAATRSPRRPRSRLATKRADVSDRFMTALQEDGQAQFGGAVAELVEAVQALGLDPRETDVWGRVWVPEPVATEGKQQT